MAIHVEKYQSSNETREENNRCKKVTAIVRQFCDGATSEIIAHLSCSSEILSIYTHDADVIQLILKDTWIDLHIVRGFVL